MFKIRLVPKFRSERDFKIRFLMIPLNSTAFLNKKKRSPIELKGIEASSFFLNHQQKIKINVSANRKLKKKIFF